MGGSSFLPACQLWGSFLCCCSSTFLPSIFPCTHIHRCASERPYTDRFALCWPFAVVLQPEVQALSKLECTSCIITTQHVCLYCMTASCKITYNLESRQSKWQISDVMAREVQIGKY